jgi:ABC-type Fe3+ transport system permease subunit
MVVSAFILVVPMVYIFVQAFSKGLLPVLQNLADPDMLHAIWLTVLVALISVPVNLVFGTLLAWLVTRFDFPGASCCLRCSIFRSRFHRWWRVLCICSFMAPMVRWGRGLMRITCKSCLPGRAWCW